ncbi:MAG: hypothetical protein ABI199_06045 [Bacteroidia bacterium]
METRLGLFQKVIGAIIFICFGLDILFFKQITLLKSIIATQIIGYVGIAIILAYLISIILRFKKTKSIPPIKGWGNFIVYIIFLILMMNSLLKSSLILFLIVGILGFIEIVIGCMINLKRGNITNS